jgi:hypothetical protein
MESIFKASVMPGLLIAVVAAASLIYAQLKRWELCK